MSHNPTPTLVLTRPRGQLQGWTKALEALGATVVGIPLLDILPPPEPEPLRLAIAQVWAGAFDAVVFVSPTAVDAFFAAVTREAATQPATGGAACPPPKPWPAAVSAAGPGAGTAQALIRWGVSDQAILQPGPDAPAADSEALWAVMAPWAALAPRRVLIVRGDGGRNWLGQQLRSHGAEVQALCAYRRGAPQLTAEEWAQLHLALAEPQRHLWVFSSSEALAHLPRLLPTLQHLPHLQAVATHPHIQAAAAALGLRHTQVCEPQPAAVWAMAAAYNDPHGQP